MELFDTNIPILLNNATQREYDSLCKEFSGLDYSYVFNGACLERRQYIQEAYDKCKDYLDDDFAEQIRIPGKFISRLWELQLCSILLFFKMNLVRPPSSKTKLSRPDFCILDSSGKKIWIEAVCPDVGNVPKKEDMIPGIIYTRNGNITDDLEIVSPRITSVIQSKYSKRELYNLSKDFNLDDSYVIAINTHHISHRETREMPKELVLYGMGLQWIKQNGESGRHFHWTVPKYKQDGTVVDVDVALFFREEYRGLSAVMTSSNWFQFGEDFETLMSEDIITYFNHDADSEIDSREINFGKKNKMLCVGDKCKLEEI